MLTIVIPTLNAEKTLPTLLASMGDMSAVRLIVSDGGSTDGTLAIAAKAGAVICAGKAGRGAQLARGGDWAFASGAGENSGPSHLLFLHADCRLLENWYQTVQSFITSDPQKTGYFRYKPCQKSLSGFIIKRWVDLRCWAWRLPYGDQGLLIPAAIYKELGGYLASYPLFEDVEFVDRIKEHSGRKGFGPLPTAMQTDISDHLCQGVWKRGWRNYKLLRAYRKGEPVQSLYEQYHAKP